MKATVEVVASLGAVERDEWDSIVAPNDLLKSYDYSQALEKGGVSDCEYRFFLCRDGKSRVIAHSPFYCMTMPLDTLLPKGTVANRLIQRVRSHRSGFLKARIVEAGSPVALGTTIAFRDDIGRADRREIVRALVAAMEAFRTERSASLMAVRDFRGSNLGDFFFLTELGFAVTANLPDTLMLLVWRSFDEYVDSLKSRYRHRVLGNLAKAERCGIKREFVRDFEAHADGMARLYQETYRRAREYQREELGPDYFASLCRHLPGRTNATLQWSGDELVGFCVHLIDGDVLRANYLGVDYGRNRKASLVLNLYYSAIELAIELGMSAVSLGFTTYGEKQALGLEVDPLFAFIRSGSAVPTGILAAVQRRIVPLQETWGQEVFRHSGSPVGSE